MIRMNPDDQAKVFKALSDPARVCIVRKLASPSCSGSFGCASSDLDLTQPSISHHFHLLTESGIVTEHKRGRRKYYQLDHDVLHAAGIDITALKHKEQTI
jgi:ArsR family transcriptional regulator